MEKAFILIGVGILNISYWFIWKERALVDAILGLIVLGIGIGYLMSFLLPLTG